MPAFVSRVKPIRLASTGPIADSATMIPLLALRCHDSEFDIFKKGVGLFPAFRTVGRSMAAMIAAVFVSGTVFAAEGQEGRLTWKQMESPFEVIDQLATGEGLYFSGCWRMNGGIPDEVKALMPFDAEILTRLDESVSGSRYFGFNRFVFEVSANRRQWDARLSDDDSWMQLFLTDGESLEWKEGDVMRLKAGSLWRPSFDLTCMDSRTGSGMWTYPDAGLLDRVLGNIDQEMGVRVNSSIFKLDRFSRVLGMKTAECALTVSNHLSDDGERLIVSVYTFQFLHSLPPGFMGGFDLIQRQAKQRFEKIVERFEGEPALSDVKVLADDSPVVSPESKVVLSVL